jgi:hypothetical protein
MILALMLAFMTARVLLGTVCNIGCRKLLQKNSLPTAYDLMERPPTKWKWKAMLNKAVEEHHMTEWYNEVEDKTSLKYLTVRITASNP